MAKVMSDVMVSIKSGLGSFFPDREGKTRRSEYVSDMGVRLERLLASEDYKLAYLPIMQRLKEEFETKDYDSSDEALQRDGRAGIRVLRRINKEINTQVELGRKAGEYLKKIEEKSNAR